MTSTTLAHDCTTLAALKDIEKDLTAQAKEAKKTRESAERNLITRMEAEECRSFRTPDGSLFVPTQTVYAQVQDRAAFVEWAEQNEIELLEKTERKALCSELVRERLDNNEPMPPGMGYYIKEYVSRTAG